MTAAAELKRQIHRLDAAGVPLGRLATRIADLLRGKHRPTFVHHLDQGDSVVVVNARQIKLTGRKFDTKEYHWHTGYLGHLKTRTARQIWERRPADLIERAVTGMLPNNRLKAGFLKRLTIFADEESVRREHPQSEER